VGGPQDEATARERLIADVRRNTEDAARHKFAYARIAQETGEDVSDFFKLAHSRHTPPVCMYPCSRWHCASVAWMAVPPRLCAVGGRCFAGACVAFFHARMHTSYVGRSTTYVLTEYTLCFPNRPRCALLQEGGGLDAARRLVR
jgi:hypothetical protein